MPTRITKPLKARIYATKLAHSQVNTRAIRCHFLHRIRFCAAMNITSPPCRKASLKVVRMTREADFSTSYRCSALYNPKAALSATGMIVYAILAIALWYREPDVSVLFHVRTHDQRYNTIGYFKMSRPRSKWMRWLPVGTTMMSVGLGIRIARRNGTGAWSFLGETIVSNSKI